MFDSFHIGARPIKAPWNDTIVPLAAKPFGSVSGHVFSDKNGNGVQDPGEQDFSNRLVFVDVNKNGIRDPGERYAKSDANGNYVISHVSPGEYYVVVQEKGAYHASAPLTQITTYSWDDYSYAWVEIGKNGNQLILNNQDDGYAFYEANQPISFHGEHIDINVSANGFISFDQSTAALFYNLALPNYSAPSNMIAPLWDDFTFAAGGGVYAIQTDTSVIIEWKNAQHFGDTSGQLSTFEAIINYDGTIVFQYKTVADSVTATIGTQIGRGIESTQIGDTASNPANHSAYILTPSNSFVRGVAIVDVNANETTTDVNFGLTKVPLANQVHADLLGVDTFHGHQALAMHDLNVTLV